MKLTLAVAFLLSAMAVTCIALPYGFSNKATNKHGIAKKRLLMSNLLVRHPLPRLQSDVENGDLNTQVMISGMMMPPGPPGMMGTGMITPMMPPVFPGMMGMYPQMMMMPPYDMMMNPLRVGGQAKKEQVIKTKVPKPKHSIF